jgi:hypothetical protein
VEARPCIIIIPDNGLRDGEIHDTSKKQKPAALQFTVALGSASQENEKLSNVEKPTFVGPFMTLLCFFGAINPLLR